MAGMSGAALGAEALPVIGAGAVGAVAGTETQLGVYEALDRAGANSDTKQSLSDIAGGAVGGAVFSGASIAGAAAMGQRWVQWGSWRCCGGWFLRIAFRLGCVRRRQVHPPSKEA